MHYFNINRLPEEQKGLLALVCGVVLALHNFRIIQLNIILELLAFGLIIYGLMKTHLLKKIVHFIKKQVKNNNP